MLLAYYGAARNGEDQVTYPVDCAILNELDSVRRHANDFPKIFSIFKGTFRIVELCVRAGLGREEKRFLVFVPFPSERSPAFGQFC